MKTCVWFLSLTASTLLRVVTVCEGQLSEPGLSPCYPDGIFDVVENSASNVLSYTTYHRFYDVKCRWRTNDTIVTIGWCFRFPFCDLTANIPLFALSAVSIEEVRLTIDTTNTSLFSRSESFANSTIECMGDRFRSHATCRTDFIYPARDSSCTVQFQKDTSPWSVVSRCTTPKAFSALGRYSCQLLSSHGMSNMSIAGVPVAMATTPIGNGDYVNGVCDITSSLPSDDGDYNYTVMISPGRLNFTASFVGTNNIRRPISAKVSHTCPEFVDEGQNLDCSCSSSDMGSPQGSLSWNGTSSADLLRAHVRREDDSTSYICQFHWNATLMTQETYILKVLVSSKMLEEREARDMGIGIGIGLAVAAVCTVTAVVFLWRRGWTLPCAANTRTSRAFKHASNDTSHESQGAQGEQPPLQNLDAETIDGPPRIYDSLQRNQAEASSAYEDIKVDNKSDPTSAASPARKPDRERQVYSNHAFNSEGAAYSNVDIVHMPERKPRRKPPKTESPVYGNVS